MDAIEVKMQSPTKKRAGGDDHYPDRGVKRQAITPPRLTRAMLKKLNENGGTTVELNPGLEMGVRRRGWRARPPKRAAEDDAFVGSIKRTSTTRKRAAKPRAKGKQLKQPQPVKSQPAESQPAEPQFTGPQPVDQEKRVSEADVAAASRLAQAAIAAGLTGMTSEAGTPLVGDPPSLVRFTKRDLRDLLSEAVVDDGIRQKLEPHWLARTEFLTWWERPATDMDHIKEEVRRLAVRWSKDLQTQHPDAADIPISMLESWRADIVIVGDPKEDKGDNEAKNDEGNAADDKNGDEKEECAKEKEKKEGETQGEGIQGAKEKADEKRDGKVEVDDSCEVFEALALSLALAMRETAEWREAFDKEIATEPDFRSKRAWTARVSESQREATSLQEKVRDLDAQKSEWITKSATQAADGLLGELQRFRVGLRMDREAFWDEFNQEGADLLLEKTERAQSAEEEIRKDTKQGEAQETETDFKTDLEAELEAELAREDIQMVEVQAEKEGTRTTEIGDRHDPSASDESDSEVEPGPNKPLSEVKNNDNDPKPTTVGTEHAPEEKPTQGLPPSVQPEESSPEIEARVTKFESHCVVLETHRWRAAETYAGENTISPPQVEEEEKFKAVLADELEQQDQGEPGETRNSRESTPWLPDKRGSHSSSWKWPGRQQEGSEVTTPDTTAVEEQEKPSHEVNIDLVASLFNSANIEEPSNEGEHTTDRTLPSFNITRLTPDMISVESNTRSATLEITTGEVENTADSSSTASDISSLPENSESSTSGRSETAEEVEVEHPVDRASDTPLVISVQEDTSLPQDRSTSITGVPTENTEEVDGRIVETMDNISPMSHINSLLQEASLPRGISSSITTGAPSRSVEEIGGEPEETVDRISATNSPQSTSLPRSGIPSGSDMGVGGEVEHTVDVHAPANSDAAGLPQGSNVGEDLDALAISVGESPIVVPTVRYIKPQWESLFSPEEPTYDYSANEAEAEEDEDDEVESVDDREVDDVDP